MALIIPVSSSPYQTYADSSQTEGGFLRKYVLAQFRGDSNLEWVKELRAKLVKDELKYKDFIRIRPRLKKERKLWGRIKNGVGQATIVIIDPEPVYDFIEEYLKEDGAEKGIDFDKKIIINQCSIALVEMTPISYLPLRLYKTIPWNWILDLSSLDEYLPEDLTKEIGGKLRDAKVFAARAHATFDLINLDESVKKTSDIINSPLKLTLLAELASTIRIFDIEHEKSIGILNRAVQLISRNIEILLPEEIRSLDTKIIQEADSRTIDEIQASDIAAGWARDMLDTSDHRAIGAYFERVWYNGILLK